MYPAWFHPRILVGAGFDLSFMFMIEHRITHVINCAADEHSPEWFRKLYPAKYKVINAIDSSKHNILTWYPLFEKSLHEFLKEGDGVVYVHCQMGINRSGFLALTYVCKNFGYNLEYMISATKRQRPILFQNTTYMNQVRDFINGCLQGPKDSGKLLSGSHDGNTGLSPQGDRTEPQGIVSPTGSPGEGNGGDKTEVIGDVCEERHIVNSSSEPVSESSS